MSHRTSYQTKSRKPSWPIWGPRRFTGTLQQKQKRRGKFCRFGFSRGSCVHKRHQYIKKQNLGNAVIFDFSCRQIQGCKKCKMVGYWYWKKIWNVPPEDDKVKDKNRSRIIFLNDAAVNLLKKVVRFSDSPYVFCNSYGRAYSDMAMNQVIRKAHARKKLLDGIGWIDKEKS